MPLSQVPAHAPVAKGTQAEPGGSPNARQSASFLQSAQPLTRAASDPQKVLPPVVSRQTQLIESLQSACAGSAALQNPGFP